MCHESVGSPAGKIKEQESTTKIGKLREVQRKFSQGNHCEAGEEDSLSLTRCHEQLGFKQLRNCKLK